MSEISFQQPFQLNKDEKRTFLLEKINELTEFHQQHCDPYRNILRTLPFNTAFTSLDEIPYLPVQLFKMLELYSVPREEIFKTLTSSGTTSQQVSKIFVDKDTAMLQSRALAAIVSSFIGKKRLPMLIIDSNNILKDRKAFSARGAGIIGFSNFGRDHFYLLDGQMEIDFEGLQSFLERHQGEKILAFGFTFMVWRYFYQACKAKGMKINFNDGILIHGGGWKKLQDEAVSTSDFNAAMQEQFQIQHVHNYYGMVEQVGSIFMECDYGHLHAPDYADVIIRDPHSLKVLPFLEKGLVQVLSVLPKSFPGHSLLTEDLGTILGEDDCPCGRMGKYFTIEGRLPKAELRGCSDTHAFEAVSR
ncbi:acyl-protein synthetase [Schinkia azotoformans]|uniref:LuxE/PaaK family acyltransferase n=1 Tax=Schinkia azotoformans TaxID=1454 RepID=UPI002E1CEE4B|nr:acyl-protein synthetase [Schinkia azotoformans]